VTDTGGLKLVTRPTPIPVGVPTHLALTYDGAFIRGYYNGVLETPVAQTGALTADDEQVNVARGGEFAAPLEFFAHRVDEVAMYDKVLTDARILTHYLDGL
jgi:hypothetical protein